MSLGTLCNVVPGLFFSYNPAFLDKNATMVCDYPQNYLKKLVWNKVKSNAPDFYHLLENMYIGYDEFNLLLGQHKDAGGAFTSKGVACHWLRKKKSVWSSWLLSGLPSGKVPVYLGGMFPMDDNDGALWVRPGILTGLFCFILLCCFLCFC